MLSPPELTGRPLSEIVCPIDTHRYGTEEMRRLFVDGNRYRCFLQIEAALAEAQAEVGIIPSEAASTISNWTWDGDFFIRRVVELERQTKHELAAVIRAFAEQLQDHGRFVHYGATSSDILDTAMAMQIKSAIAVLERKMAGLLDLLCQLAKDHAGTVMVGRTHGQHALPITFGFKVAIWADELARNLQRLRDLKPRVLVGKMSGAVGSMAGFGQHGELIQKKVMAKLGLFEPAISNQAIARDRVAEFMLWAALVAAFLETIATEVRNLQRSEISELEEPFQEETQVGSSAMPHKRNPVLCENICSLARLIRSFSVPALENISLWHERDLTNSGNERFTIPQCCILTDEILEKMLFVGGHLRVNGERMMENLKISRSTILAERVLLALVSKGMVRHSAYSLVQAIAFSARSQGMDFRQALASDPRITSLVSMDEIPEFLEDSKYIGHCRSMAEKVEQICEKELRTCEKKEEFHAV
jgi:adenylosuccinate lyase